MWTGKRSAGQKERYEPSVEYGVVTQSEGVTGVYLDGERRQMGQVSPGGYRWKPGVGQEVLVLKDGDGRQHMVAVALTEEALKPGEVEICSEGGALIRLAGDKVEIEGEVFLAGQDFQSYIEEMVENLVKELLG